mgnify:FL=1
MLEQANDVPQSENANTDTRQLKKKKKLVGLNFNPSNDDKVSKAKRLCAELADLLNDDRQERETTQLESLLFPQTVGKILDAQMNVVKLLTLKY